MILLFPDPDAVRLALTSGLVPADVTLAPAAVSTDAQGRLYVEPSVSLSRSTGKILDRLGVKGSKRHGSDAVRQVGSWVELVPLSKEAGTPEVSSSAAVLFELPTADDLPAVVTELLRLGNDRQGFRWFAADGGDHRVLLRVIGPPYYTLLRALDGPAGGMRAYLERAPRVWVEFGHTHPLAAQVRVAEGQFALVTAPADWRFLDDAPFRDVYELTEFPLPGAPRTWEAAEAPEKITVPLRLTAGNAADVPELWVLRDDPVGQLDALVRDADERLTQRLTFAVAETAAGKPVAVLRTRPSKEPPPVLALEGAAAFKPYWKLPNLFVPVGRRLHPTLRRDAVRRLLADDPDRVVWLYPEGATGFAPESVPDAAFRSLEDWVDYVIEAERAALAAWVGATRFDLEHFVCTDAAAPKPKPDKPDREPKEKDDAPPLKPEGSKSKPARAKAPKADPAGYVPPPPEAVAPNAWKLRAKELEDRFLAADGPLDADERAALWPQLAAAYTRAGDATADAAVCWLNALWTATDPPAEWLAEWAAAEFPQQSGAVGAAEIDAKLKSHAPSVAEPRAVVAAFLAAAARTPPPGWLVSRLPALKKYLDAQQSVLPVRAAWLAAVRLAQLAGDDTYGLTQARDRLLTQLLDQGLRPERDLPSFLRVAGHRDADRIRAVREKALGLHAATRAWVAHHPASGRYIDLLFAFALGRLGEGDAARELHTPRPAADAPPRDGSDPVVTRLLTEAFEYRIAQAVAAAPHTGPLPATVYDQLAALKARPAGEGDKSTPAKYSETAYVIDRMREESRVLEPEDTRDPYGMFRADYRDNPLSRAVLELGAVRTPGKQADQARRLLREGFPNQPLYLVQFEVLREVLRTAPRVGESFTAELVRLVPGVLRAMPASTPLAAAGKGTVGSGVVVTDQMPTKQGELVERAIFAAGHFGRSDLLRPVIDAYAGLVRERPEPARFLLINAAAGQLFRSLKRLGMRDELDRFLGLLRSEVGRGAGPGTLRGHYANRTDQWAVALETLLSLAAGWLTLGLTEHALPILDETRTALFAEARRRADQAARRLPLGTGSDAIGDRTFAHLLRTYVAALGHAEVGLGLPRILEVFQRVPGDTIENNWTGKTSYSRFHLWVAENVVWALVSDEFALGPTARKWLDDDEEVVRRRVHADLGRQRA